MSRRDANFIIDLAIVVGTQLGRPMRIVEWGSGRSTLSLPRLIRSALADDVEWLTIEYNRAYWRNHVKPQLKGFVGGTKLQNGVEVEHFRPESGLKVSAMVFDYGELTPFEPGRYEDGLICMADYECAAQRQLDQNLADFVIVDGRKRARVLAQSSKLLSYHGIAVLHDAQREAYWSAFHAFRSGAFVAPMMWIGGNMHTKDMLRMISLAWERVDINDS